MATASSSGKTERLAWRLLAIEAVVGAVLLIALAWQLARPVAPAGPPALAAAQPATAAPLPSPVPLLKAAAPAPAPVPPLVVRRVLPIDGPIKLGDYVWDDAGVPAGPVVITVDLSARVLSVFRGGYEIGAAAILYGADNMPTPTGAFPITQKDARHVSNLYDAPMPYMLRLTNDGITIHGSIVAQGYATHGCVGIPIPFAKLVFGQAKVGDLVLITDGRKLSLGAPITA